MPACLSPMHSIPCPTQGPTENCLVVLQSLSRVWLFVTPWIAAHQASLSITITWSLLKLMSIESVMPSSCLSLCCPLLFLPSILPQHQGLFQRVSSLHQVTKVLELHLGLSLYLLPCLQIHTQKVILWNSFPDSCSLTFPALTNSVTSATYLSGCTELSQQGTKVPDVEEDQILGPWLAFSFDEVLFWVRGLIFWVWNGNMSAFFFFFFN